jgi:phage tail-like protein
MANPSNDTVLVPFTSFNFSVEIYVPALQRTLCNAAFSEADGLEVTMDAKTIREGGNNAAQIRLVGPVSYGQVTLKRGMTASFDLWDWFDAIAQASASTLRSDLRGHAEVVMLAPDRQAKNAGFILERCLPVKLKAPALNARDGMVAIEELQLVYETLRLKKPEAS